MHTSYGWKHDAERWGKACGYSPYIANGAFITAALHEGLRVQRARTPTSPECAPRPVGDARGERALLRAREPRAWRGRASGAAGGAPVSAAARKDRKAKPRRRGPATSSQAIVPITIFRAAPSRGTEQHLTLADIAPYLDREYGPRYPDEQAKDSAEKIKQPLLKLGRFENQSRRRGSTVLDHWGVALDYDDPETPMAEAAERLEQAGIAALLYPTWKGLPRYRVVVPFERATPGRRRP